VKAAREEISRIHISLIDEFIAARFIEAGGLPLAFRISGADEEGTILLEAIEARSGPPEQEGIDFELSACECGGLGQDDAGIYTGRPVFTSSAYEFLDFILSHYRSFDCHIEFTGNAWCVRVENAADNVR
jgi:hypothetical protein